MNVDYSDLMDVSAVSGMGVLFFSFWLVARGYTHQQSLYIKTGKMMGLTLILLPLSTYWYFPAELLTFIGVFIVCVCVVHKLIKGLR